jgi:site-specific recombinase XerC
MSAGASFDRAADRFLAALRDQRDASPETLRAYRSDLAQFRAFLKERHGDGLPGPETLDTLAVRGFVARLHHQGISKTSIARKLSAVRSFLRHAVRVGTIDSNPADGIPTPKRPKLLPKNLTVDEAFALLDGIAGTTPPGSVTGRCWNSFTPPVCVSENWSRWIRGRRSFAAWSACSGRGTRADRAVRSQGRDALRAWIETSEPLRTCAPTPKPSS